MGYGPGLLRRILQRTPARLCGQAYEPPPPPPPMVDERDLASLELLAVLSVLVCSESLRAAWISPLPDAARSLESRADKSLEPNARQARRKSGPPPKKRGKNSVATTQS